MSVIALLNLDVHFSAALRLSKGVAKGLHGGDVTLGEGALTSSAPHLPASLRRFIEVVPKAELHVHVEGALEPELMLALAARNGLPPPYPSVEAARAAYHFTDLQSFLDLYYFGCSVLRTQLDFYDLAMSYFRRAAADRVVHAEVFFDPQTHLANGLDWSVFMPGLARAAEDAAVELGLSAAYIMCFRKEMSAASANDTLSGALPWLGRGRIIGVGLDSSELGNPPAKFAQVFERAGRLGLQRVAHAGEEGPPEYVWEALRVLHVRRVDHGVHSLEDAALMAALNASRVPLTVCPLSNLKLKVYEGQLEKRLTQLVGSGLVITVNSDDAAYFGGYAVANYNYLAQVTGMGVTQVARLAANSFEASFFVGPGSGGEARRTALLGQVAALAARALEEEEKQETAEKRRWRR
ncbi:hypothetical protein HYH02_008934 [Chlamydomonas schloesseri]|uniref:Adenosine deaminase domain-containing protein n=1 Tax=Chlamydomonas schloesseri TaxID=2026947 RepID=A0A835WCW0_9CHLO|nr:hypothetical protein HYH02_008934 [Chlamydomonas schloesseri]|eukprot:KAG2445067.1 hypothetical protein HYH02_008934 [Chlamydomonas schloesseri]